MRLAKAVQARRHELGISQAELARRADVSERMIVKLEKAQTGQRMTTQMSRVERALGWRPGSFERIRAGGDPILPPQIGGPADDLGNLPLGLREQLSGGVVREYEVVETQVEDTSVIAVFLRRKDDPPNREEVQREIEEWARTREALDRLTRGAKESDES